MTTITTGAHTITPDIVDGYEAQADSANVFHTLIGTGATAYSLTPDPPRTGTLSLVFGDRAAAWEAYNLHQGASVFTLTDADVPEVNMTYVRAGTRTITLDDETRNAWVVAIGYREVI